jgi:hypothetical protein
MARSLYVRVSQAIDNYMVASLTPSQYQLLRFINERTLRYEKEWEYIPMRHFLEGVYSGRGELLHAGLPYAKATVIKAYQGLVDIGIIKQAGGTRNKFAIDYERLLEAAHTMALAHQGLKPSRRQTVTHRTSDLEETVTHRTSPLLKEQKSRSDRYPEADASQEIPSGGKREDKGTLHALLSTVTTSREKMAARAAKLAENITQENVKGAWVTAHLEHRKERAMLSLSKSEIGKVRGVWRANRVPVPLNEFITWAVANWNEIRTHEMKWCKGFPQVPDFKFFIGMLKWFVKAFGEYNERHWEHQDMLEARRDNKASKKTMDEAHSLKKLLDQYEQRHERDQERIRKQSKAIEGMRKNGAPRRSSYLPENMKEIHELEIAPPITKSWDE